MSKFFVDTVVKTNIKRIGKTVFSNIDSTSNDTLNLKQILGSKYDQIIKDTVGYFFLANLTNKTISIKKRNNQLIAEELALFQNQGYKPISFFAFGLCGTGLDTRYLYLNPKEIVIIRNCNKRKPQKEGTLYFARLLTSSGELIISIPYKTIIPKQVFFVNTEMEKCFKYGIYKLAFQDK